jgi:hypothetical protein
MILGMGISTKILWSAYEVHDVFEMDVLTQSSVAPN